MSQILLETRGLTRRFGGLVAVNAVDFEVRKGEVTGLIGPNGAGKTTLFNNITGMDRPDGGSVLFDGRDITGLPAWKVCRLGIARTFQNIRLFRELTVLENVMTGFHASGHPVRPLAALQSLVLRRREQKRIVEGAMEWLDFMGMAHLAGETAAGLAYGRQRELEIARALATGPSVLFLDEPAAGMNPKETDSLMETIRRIGATGVSVVLIEHDMKLVMNICDHITVLNYGSRIARGTPPEVRGNPEVVEAYLGKD